MSGFVLPKQEQVEAGSGAIAAIADANGWIAVEDALPSRMHDDTSWSHAVWCIVEDYGNKYPFVGQYNLEREDWYDANDETTRLAEIGEVTYWQPIQMPI